MFGRGGALGEKGPQLFSPGFLVIEEPSCFCWFPFLHEVVPQIYSGCHPHARSSAVSKGNLVAPSIARFRGAEHLAYLAGKHPCPLPPSSPSLNPPGAAQRVEEDHLPVVGQGWGGGDVCLMKDVRPPRQSHGSTH